MTCSVTVTQVALKSGDDAASNAVEHAAAEVKTDMSASVCDEDVSTKEPRKKRRKLEEDDDGRHLQESSALVSRWMLQVYSEFIGTRY